MAKQRELNRVKILQIIFEDFQQITQWLPNTIENSLEYHHKAEQLIEILEVADCGSVGGFDNANPVKRITGYELYDRFLALVHKYKDEDKIKKSCGFTLESLGKYFKTIVNLRGDILGYGKEVE